jgi:uncharacterized protein YjiS (DUF1127 family)
MTAIDLTAAPEGTPFTAALFSALIEGVRSAARRRGQRIALGQLMAMDAHRLDDLGLSALDVIEAMNTPPAGPVLEARRAARANAGAD